MSDNQGRDEAEIQAEIDQSRQDLAAALASLAHEIQPEVQVEYLKESAKQSGETAKAKLIETYNLVRAGDRAAIIQTAIALGTTVTLAALTIRHYGKKATKKRMERREIRQWRQFLRNLSKNQPPASMDFNLE